MFTHPSQPLSRLSVDNAIGSPQPIRGTPMLIALGLYSQQFIFMIIVISGLYYKHIMIVNDTTRVISE
jgi:hypothetical protein